MGMRYIADDLEKAIIRRGYDDVGEFVNEAVRERLRRGKKEKGGEKE